MIMSYFIGVVIVWNELKNSAHLADSFMPLMIAMSLLMKVG